MREGCDEEDIHKTEHELEVCEEEMKKWEQMRTVLEMYETCYDGIGDVAFLFA